MGMQKIFFRNTLQEFHLNLQRRLTRCHTRAVADSEDMRIHRKRWLSKGNIQNHIRRFASHTGERLQLLTRVGDYAVVLVTQNLTGLHQMFGFASIKTNCFDVFLQTF